MYFHQFLKVGCYFIHQFEQKRDVIIILIVLFLINTMQYLGEDLSFD